MPKKRKAPGPSQKGPDEWTDERTLPLTKTVIYEQKGEKKYPDPPCPDWWLRAGVFLLLGLIIADKATNWSLMEILATMLHGLVMVVFGGG